jgi:hypothetical protein
MEEAQALAAELQNDSEHTWAGISASTGNQIVNMQPAGALEPFVDLLVPQQETYEEGRNLLLYADASVVDTVDFYVNGQKVFSSSEAPHHHLLTIPRVATADGIMVLQARGVNSGVEVLSEEHTLSISARSKADITGRVLLDTEGAVTPADGVAVTLDAQSLSATTGADGYFTLSAAFIDEAFNIEFLHQARGESIIWEEPLSPTPIDGAVNLGNISFREDNAETLYNEGSGRELLFTGESLDYRPLTTFTYRGHTVDYLRINKRYGQIELYDNNGYQIVYARLLPGMNYPYNNYGWQYRHLGGIRLTEKENYLAVTMDSIYMRDLPGSAMVAQVQLHSDGDLRYLYGSTEIDISPYLSGNVEFEWRGNNSGNWSSRSVNFAELPLEEPITIKPYHQFETYEYFSSGNQFDLPGRFIEFDYDPVEGTRVWSEPLQTIPVPLQ